MCDRALLHYTVVVTVNVWPVRSLRFFRVRYSCIQGRSRRNRWLWGWKKFYLRPSSTRSLVLLFAVSIPWPRSDVVHEKILTTEFIFRVSDDIICQRLNIPAPHQHSRGQGHTQIPIRKTSLFFARTVRQRQVSFHAAERECVFEERGKQIFTILQRK